MVYFTPGCFSSREIAPSLHLIGSWVGPRDGLNAVERRKILPCWESNLGHLAHNLLLYWLSYLILFHRNIVQLTLCLMQESTVFMECTNKPRSQTQAQLCQNQVLVITVDLNLKLQEMFQFIMAIQIFSKPRESFIMNFILFILSWLPSILTEFY